jgi:hypothetical protein
MQPARLSRPVLVHLSTTQLKISDLNSGRLALGSEDRL